MSEKLYRKKSQVVGVERLALHSPSIDRIEVIRRGKVRRAKLFYLRDRVGKKAKVRNYLDNCRKYLKIIAEDTGVAMPVSFLPCFLSAFMKLNKKSVLNTKTMLS